MSGRLIVFEGPDGVGKSSLSRAVATHLQSQGEACLWYAFPGHEKGTLGELVYRLHHDAPALGVSKLTAASLQTLHIAAHVDLIDSEIRPALSQGRTIVLDRYWWSTFVYGAVAGVDRSLLQAMIKVELIAWQDLKPAIVFFVDRVTPLHSPRDATWRHLRAEYRALADREQANHAVQRIANKRSLDSSLKIALASLLPHDGDRAGLRIVPAAERRRSATKVSVERAPLVFSTVAPAQTTQVYDTYWRFAVERQNIFFRRVNGSAPPWTNDPILTEYKFTNVYRAADRVSQFLIRRVIYDGDQSSTEVFFRILVFKVFNKIETWELLTQRIGDVSWSTYDRRAYDRTLSNALREHRAIYSAAYIMPSGGGAFRAAYKHQVHLQVIEQMIRDDLPSRIADAASMRDVFYLLRSYPTVGDFLAYQFAIDLNYSELTNFDETEFVMPGPGAHDGIRKCFSSLGGLTEAEIIRLVTDRQEREFGDRGLAFHTLWGRRLQLIDCQNLFCEVGKYSRQRHPDVAGTSGRTRIKQRFRPTNRAVSVWFPPKWKLNQLIQTVQIEVPAVETGDRQLPLLAYRGSPEE